MADSTYFDPEAGQFFPTIQEAKNWVKRYRDEHPQFDENNQAKNPLYSTYFSKSFVESILNQPRPTDSPCVGLRIYRATDANQKQHTVLVGVDAQGHDILYGTTALGEPNEDDVMVGDWGTSCPPNCEDSGTGLMAN